MECWWENADVNIFWFEFELFCWNTCTAEADVDVWVKLVCPAVGWCELILWWRLEELLLLLEWWFDDITSLWN